MNLLLSITINKFKELSSHLAQPCLSKNPKINPKFALSDSSLNCYKILTCVSNASLDIEIELEECKLM